MKKRVILSENQRERLVDLRRSGSSINDLVQEFDIAEVTAYKIIRDLGAAAERKKHVYLSSAEKESLVESYKDGADTATLAKEFNVTREVVSRIANSFGVARTRTEANTKYSLSHHVFDEINDEATAYWIGFLAADGSIGKKNKIKLELATKDHDHLEKFLNFIESDRPIYERCYGHPSVVVEFYSKQMVQSLARHGVVRNKTFKLKNHPEMHSSLIKHYYRGYIDGDGCIGHSITGGRWTYPYISVLGTYAFLENMQAWILDCLPGVTKTKIGTRRKISAYSKCAKSQTPAVLELIYGNASIYLDRKYEKAVEIFLGEG